MQTFLAKISYKESEIPLSFEMVAIKDSMGEKIEKYGLWEPAVSSLFFHYIRSIKEPFLFLDVGANVGYYSKVALESNPFVSVIAFEPNKEVFPILKENLRQYGDRAVCFDIGLGTENKTMPLYYAKSNYGSGSYDVKTMPPGEEYVVDEMKVLSVNNLIIEWEYVKFIKIDIQGNESELYKAIFEKLYPNSFILAEDDGVLRQTIFDSEFGMIYKISHNYLVEKFNYR